MNRQLKKLVLAVTVLCTPAFSLFSQTLQSGGTVVSATDGLPVIGAVVYEEGNTANGVTTDADGKFAITVPDGASLVFSSLGYKTVTAVAAAAMDIVLEEDAVMLEETVVTGYSVQRKADLTGSISVVDMDDLAKQNENNPIKALQGRIPQVVFAGYTPVAVFLQNFCSGQDSTKFPASPGLY